MKNTTIVLDEAVLKDARNHAGKLGYSFNAWVNQLIEQALQRPAGSSIRETLKLAKKAGGDSKGKRWTRDEIYER